MPFFFGLFGYISVIDQAISNMLFPPFVSKLNPSKITPCQNRNFFARRAMRVCCKNQSRPVGQQNPIFALFGYIAGITPRLTHNIKYTFSSIAKQAGPNLLPPKTETFSRVVLRMRFEKNQFRPVGLASQVPFWHDLGILQGTLQLD